MAEFMSWEWSYGVLPFRFHKLKTGLKKRSRKVVFPVRINHDLSPVRASDSDLVTVLLIVIRIGRSSWFMRTELRARKTAASKKRSFNGRCNLSRRQNTPLECVLSARWIILLRLLLPNPISPGARWKDRWTSR